ncbi:uncharacterized protein BX664DRAFT_326036 [Halteromyces radiatus]|uniref:uncharacterized protein n=1 Tax=Halteromyces radiatus TaxID=101107 RepID=UPI002220CE2D|nr:uncharacterized protein BX664DRAFT_326036 [Halteromyces radiatus]KAI8097288.1 hypothetical protein BX664DRAFT_326036 [Halteromyces radiatus]
MADETTIKSDEQQQNQSISSPCMQKESGNITSPSASDNTTILPNSTADNEQRKSPSTSTVTSSSPTQPAFNSQAYHQQLHEAMMAFDSHGMSQNLMAAAAAAMAAAVGVSSSPSSTPAPTLQQQQQQKDIDEAKRESIRTANRERKKKWRIHNEERNKDNDLRCRVNKRAGKLFGEEDSEAKRQWVEEEFEKRREKRREKERRKDVVNNVLSVPHSTMPQQTATDDLAHSFAAYPAVFDASKILDIPPDLQRHILEQLNLALTNSKLPTPPMDYGQPMEGMAESSTSQSSDLSQQLPTDGNQTGTDEATAAASAAAAAAELLAATASTAITTSGISAASTTSQSSPTSVAAVEADDQKIQQTSPVDDPETNNTDNTSIKKEDEGSGKQSLESSDENGTTTKEEKPVSTEQGDNSSGKKQEYPMDAVLTLMQLNAGWKK